MAVMIPLRRLVRHCNPLSPNGSAWGDATSEADVREALAAGRLLGRPNDCYADGFDHAGRIAYLIQHPAPDPILIDVGVPGWGRVDWIILDGNHRVAAAMLRGDKQIAASVMGSLEYAHALFGVNCAEPVQA